MAQAGYTPISLYYSTTASAQPTSGNLVAGELALNTLDEKLYFKNSAGTVKLLASSASTTNVQTISFGSTGLTPSTATSGAVTVAGTLAIANGGTGSTSTTYCSLTTNVTGTLPVANGGTGVASATAYALLAGGTTTTGPFQSIASVGTSGQVLTSNGAGALPTFQAASGGVTTISFGSTGLTPSTATSGAVSVAGTLAIANGGTGSTSTTYCSLTSNVTGTLPIANGGTGSTSTTFVNAATNVTGTLPVANGGTGATTQTAYAVLAGGTTSTGAYQSIASVGTSGQVLTSNGAGALPTFQAAGGGFPVGTRMSFQQTSAPTGWTKDTTAAINDSILRLVTGSATSGGTTAFSTWNAQTATGDTTLSTAQIPSHSHTGGIGAGSGQFQAAEQPFAAAGNTGSTGGGGSHNHSLTQTLKYYDFIIAAKD
jgi:hypothetical protein